MKYKVPYLVSFFAKTLTFKKNALMNGAYVHCFQIDILSFYSHPQNKNQSCHRFPEMFKSYILVVDTTQQFMDESSVSTTVLFSQNPAIRLSYKQLLVTCRALQTVPLLVFR